MQAPFPHPVFKKAISRVAEAYSSHRLRHYAKAKLRSDPIYRTVQEELAGSKLPVLDFGCGIGLMGLLLYCQGYQGEIVGEDCDAGKIAEAQKAAWHLQAGARFFRVDARDAPMVHGNVALIDVLQYLPRHDHGKVLANAANALAPHGKLLIRSGVRDNSWRSKVSFLLELGIRASGWIRGEAIHIPTRDEIQSHFPKNAFKMEVRPLWGLLPLNNYLFVIQRHRTVED